MSKILKLIATLGPIGYLPAPGTMGTIAAIPLAYGIARLCVSWQIMIIIVSFAFSYFIIDRALQYFNSSDPSHIILDEVIGTFVTFCGISYNPFFYIIGFILFRVFDIFKPFGISRLEKIPGSFGVLIDDVAAGLLVNIIIRLYIMSL